MNTFQNYFYSCLNFFSKCLTICIWTLFHEYLKNLCLNTFQKYLFITLNIMVLVRYSKLNENNNESTTQYFIFDSHFFFFLTPCFTCTFCKPLLTHPVDCRLPTDRNVTTLLLTAHQNSLVSFDKQWTMT